MDSLDQISRFTGLDRPTLTEIVAEVKANHARLASCPLHHYDVEKVKLGEKMTCTRCAGTMSLTDVGHYIKGYVAAGKPASDIWPYYGS